MAVNRNVACLRENRKSQVLEGYYFQNNDLNIFIVPLFLNHLNMCLKKKKIIKTLGN